MYLHNHPLNDDLRRNRHSDVETLSHEEKPIPFETGKRKRRVVGPTPVIVLLIVVVGLIAVTAEFVSIRRSSLVDLRLKLF